MAGLEIGGAARSHRTSSRAALLIGGRAHV